jgi:phosphoenolpyruvate-protein kinase (PTS system EI component)
MAGRPRCFLPLFGMGLREFSMSPAFVPTVKGLVRAMDGKAAKEIATRVLEMRTVGEIRAYLTERLRETCPDVAVFDTFQ